MHPSPSGQRTTNGSGSTEAATDRPNAAIHRIAITQLRIHPDAKAFIARRLETGSTKREALRLLKRKLANVVYQTLLADTQQLALEAAA